VTEEFAADLGNGLRWGKATVPCSWVDAATELRTIKTTKKTKKNNNKYNYSQYFQRNSKILQWSLSCKHIFFCSFLKYIIFTYATIACIDRYHWAFCEWPALIKHVFFITFQALTSWRIVISEKLTGPQLLKKSPHFMGPEGSSPHSQQPATCPYP
jgi:hypothetical protein